MRRRKLQKPRGLVRWLNRSPIVLYRLGLGWLLSRRFLHIIHTGRVSSQPRHTVIEVVSRDPARGIYYVVSAWGEHADWLLNLQKHPECRVEVGRERFDARARRLSPTHAEEVILDYAHRHPRALRSLAVVMGFEVDGSEDQYRQMARQLPVVALAPR